MNKNDSGVFTMKKNQRFKPVWLLLAGLGLLMMNVQCSISREADYFPIPERISKKDVQYLKWLARDTWACIDYMVDKNTQLPNDNIQFQNKEWTSVTNIGLYVASLAAAVDMRLISRKEALRRLDILLANLDVFVKWNGFTQTWNSVKNGAPASHDPWISILDSGNYYAGLMVGRAYFHELREAFSAQIDIADWATYYNAETQKIKFGYNTKTEEMGGDLDDLGGDPRLAYFVAIALGQVPPESWTRLNRNMEERHGQQYLRPGWQGGGLFMQYISGTLLDERSAFLGMSAANFTFAQILHARQEELPVWGWSACEAPAGNYLGVRLLRDEIVTPHASALAISHYPTLVIENLRKLEDMGARLSYNVGGSRAHFGFRDSIDVTTKAVSDNYLMLDQCLLFLSLANFLDDGIIWKTLKQDAAAQHGYEVIADLQPQDYSVESAQAPGQNISVFDLRDTDKTHTRDKWGSLAGENVFVHSYRAKKIKSAEAVAAAAPVTLDGRLTEWGKARPIILTIKEDSEHFRMKKTIQRGAKISFMWDDTYLYFAAEVQDEEFIFTRREAEIWQDDVIELFVSPDPSAFVWGNRRDFQIGLTAGGPDGKPQAWAWFQDGNPGKNVKVASRMGDDLLDGKPGYILEAKIRWSFLGVKPRAGESIGVSPAVHFVDESRQNELKLNWCFLPDGKSLGKLTLIE